MKAWWIKQPKRKQNGVHLYLRFVYSPCRVTLWCVSCYPCTLNVPFLIIMLFLKIALNPRMFSFLFKNSINPDFKIFNLPNFLNFVHCTDILVFKYLCTIKLCYFMLLYIYWYFLHLNIVIFFFIFRFDWRKWNTFLRDWWNNSQCL